MNLHYTVVAGVIFLMLYEMHFLESRRIEFTNIKCSSMDEEFSNIEYCFLKAANRSYKYLSLKIRLLKIPVHQFTVNLALRKRSNGLMPFNQNITFDGCKMVADAGNRMISFLFSLFKPYSNINHSCPYDHDLLVDRLPTHFVHHQFTGYIPFPEGDYVFNSNWIVNGSNRVSVRVHFSFT
ncbi:uncharacterized protein LOC6549399 [Drosophila erecta]|uniref:MD-2-related lipid-recognition domain-containing protein n=1 Tax=Drosophila erecta TaxID=7220 RepID=B3NLD1_DROER|nr:uncharacterized protein LOC6549399 [Drosophila erecta]EDV54847.1 uncharacterized protein Dere_GG21747 [Drosophila erecta]